MTPARIALVSLSPMGIGGVETHLLQIIEGLSRDFDFVAVGDIREPFASQARERAAQVIPLPPSSKFDARMILRLQALFRSNRISIVHTHEARAGLLGRVAGRVAGRVTLHTVHTPAFFLARGGASIWAYQQVERLLNGFASNAVIFVSPAIRDLYSRLGLVPASKSFLIPNGLEKDWFQFEQAPGQPEGIRFLYVGRLAPEKELLVLLQAFDRVARDHPRACLQIVGSGPLRDQLLGWVSQQQLEGRVRFLGSLSREEARQVMRESDVFVLPSRFESMSYTLLEAMACGLACIVTDVGGNPDLIEDGRTGLLVPQGNVAALENAMRSLAHAPDLRRRLGSTGHDRASQYTVERMLESTRKLYFSLLAPHGLSEG